MDKMSEHAVFMLFVVLPYVALFSIIGASIWRYLYRPFTYSSLSSQFLENKQHLWISAPFHYGIIIALMGHLIGFLIPRSILFWNSKPLRLYIFEITALVFGLMALIGIAGAVIRRLTEPKVYVGASVMDWVVYCLLLVQIISGVYVSVYHTWGASWYAVIAVPYLRSLFAFSPDLTYIYPMPLIVKAHIVNAWLLIGLLPYSRLVHILVVPIPYIWRKPQVVRWNGPEPDRY